jgi:hypothetical protein
MFDWKAGDVFCLGIGGSSLLDELIIVSSCAWFFTWSCACCPAFLACSKLLHGSSHVVYAARAAKDGMYQLPACVSGP